jgi:hypothetical protein
MRAATRMVKPRDRGAAMRKPHQRPICDVKAGISDGSRRMSVPGSHHCHIEILL